MWLEHATQRPPLSGHDADLFERLARRPVDQEGNVVDVARSAVGQHGDKLVARAQAGGHQPRELAKVIRRHHRRGRAADIVQGVVGQEREGLARFCVLDRENRHVGIRGTGGAVEHIGTGARIHLHAVQLAEGIQRHFAGLEEPAAVEDLVRQRMRGVADRGGAKAA